MALRIGRRQFMSALVGAAMTWPLAARAQQGDRVRRIGVLTSLDESDTEAQAEFDEFRDELQKLGWTDGQNIRIEFRGIAGDLRRVQTAAAQMVGNAPDVIVSSSGPVLEALQKQTQTIPIVFIGVADVVRAGFVSSLAKPGGNVTGFTNFEAAIGGKWVEILKEIAPRVGRVAVIHNPEIAPQLLVLRAIQNVAPVVGIDVIPAGVHDSTEVKYKIEALAREQHGGLIVVPNPITFANHDLIIDIAVRHNLPAVYGFSFFVRTGGLVSYGLDQSKEFRKAAGYVDRVLKGEKPADLPVQAPNKYELAVNLKTAKALGLSVPSSLLATADEVIE